MKNSILSATLISIGVFAIASCGSSDDSIKLAGDTSIAVGAGEGLFEKAKAADSAGKTKKAIKLYDEVADEFPNTRSAAKARFRQAELLQSQGEIIKSFDAYQQYIDRYQGKGLYASALKQQAEMAKAAASGELKTSFGFLKRRFSVDRIVEMLNKVRKNAPKTKVSASAQFMIAEIYEAEGDTKKAMAAYRLLVSEQPESPRAPGALFRVGEILIEQADSGNRNEATLELAEEAFNDYLIQYPSHSKTSEARQKLKELRKRELNRSLDIAEYYYKTGQFESAKIYYRELANKDSSSAIKQKARARLKELGE